MLCIYVIHFYCVLSVYSPGVKHYNSLLSRGFRGFAKICHRLFICGRGGGGVWTSNGIAQWTLKEQQPLLEASLLHQMVSNNL